jgi:hypothetical protein
MRTAYPPVGALAFVSPRIAAAAVDCTAPADLTVTGLAKALPYSWAEQERSIGLVCSPQSVTPNRHVAHV